MDLMNRPHSEREIRVAQAGREELADRVGRVVREEETFDLPEGLRLLRASSPTELEHGVSFPAFLNRGKNKGRDPEGPRPGRR